MAFVRIKKHNKEIERILSDANLSTKVSIFFSYKSFGDDYDEYEANAIDLKLNPKTIRAYVCDITTEALVYKQYGLHEIGAKEIICDARYKEWFEKCSKIVINGNEYQTFKEAAGQRAVITSRPFNTIRVIVNRRVQ